MTKEYVLFCCHEYNLVHFCTPTSTKKVSKARRLKWGSILTLEMVLNYLFIEKQIAMMGGAIMVKKVISTCYFTVFLPGMVDLVGPYSIKLVIIS